ncbi:hypothetical protein, partial [Bacteroides rodentium]
KKEKKKQKNKKKKTSVPNSSLPGAGEAPPSKGVLSGVKASPESCDKMFTDCCIFAIQWLYLL